MNYAKGGKRTSLHNRTSMRRGTQPVYMCGMVPSEAAVSFAVDRSRKAASPPQPFTRPFQGRGERGSKSLGSYHSDRG